MLNDNRNNALIAHTDGSITQWDLRNPQNPVKTLNLHGEECRSVEYDPSLNYLVSSSFDGSSVIYDLKKENICQRIRKIFLGKRL